MTQATLPRLDIDEQDAVTAIVAESPRCILCIAAATHLPSRRVAQVLTALSEHLSTDLLCCEGRCRDCSEYRFVFRLLTQRQSR